MNNFLCTCFWDPRPKIPEEYLRPQGLYSLERVDLKKLKRLIRNEQLAPCHPGMEEPGPAQDLEECPICFLHYPVLNSSLCCQKRVCTECFLQVQTSTPPHQLSACPFCKVTRQTGYLVKLVGARTAEEKEQERVEEQKVIEARIREREEEIRRDQERALQRQQQQQQQQQTATAATGSASPIPTLTNTNTNSVPQQQPSPGVMAAAAAAASTLEPSGVNTTLGAPGARAGGRGPTATVTAEPLAFSTGSGGVHGSHYTGRYHNSDRHRSTGAAAAAGPNATVVQVGVGVGMYPTGSARRAATVTTVSTSIQQHHPQNTHQHQHPGDRYSVGPEAVGGDGQPDGSDNSTAVSFGGGGHQRRAQAGGGAGGRRYRLTDYVPAGVVDIAMGLDDINDLMLEQAMYESLAEAAAASSPQTETAATTASLNGGSGDIHGHGHAPDLVSVDTDNDAALAAALVASLNVADGDEGAAIERPTQTLPTSRASGTAAAISSSQTAGGPAGRFGWRHGSARDGHLAAVGQSGGGPITAVTSNSGAAAVPAPPSPTGRASRTAGAIRQAAGAVRSAQGGRAQQQRQHATAATHRVARTATPSHLPLARGPSPPASGAGTRERRVTRDSRVVRDVDVDEEEEAEALVSRRIAVAPPSPPKQTSGPSLPSAEIATVGRPGGPGASFAEVPQETRADCSADTEPQSSETFLAEPSGFSAAPVVTDTAATCVASGAASRVGPESVALSSPITLSPVPSDSPIGALAAATSDFSSTAMGSAAPREDLLEAVAGAAEKHVNNPLYDMWSNSSSATTCKHGCVDAQAQAAGGLAAAAHQTDDAARHEGRAAGGTTATNAASVAALARWGVKCGSERSSLGSDGGTASQQCGGQEKPAAQQQQQHEEQRVDLTQVSPLAAGESKALTGRAQSMRSSPPPPIAVSTPPAFAAAMAASSASVTPSSPTPALLTPGSCGLATPSPRLCLPPLNLSPPTPSTAADAAIAASATEDAPARTSLPTDIQTEASMTTVVTIQTLAAELLRHGSGAVANAAAEASSTSSHVVAVGMVFQVPNTGAGGPHQYPSATQSAAAAAGLTGPAWVENPDGSLQVLLPADGGRVSEATALAGASRLPGRQRQARGADAVHTDDIMNFPYADYDLPEPQPATSLGSVCLDVMSSVPYVAYASRRPALVALEGMDQKEEQVADDADKALIERCNEADRRLKRIVAAGDKAVAAAIVSGDRHIWDRVTIGDMDNEGLDTRSGH